MGSQPDLTEEEESFQTEVRDFVDDNLPPLWGTSEYINPSSEAEQIEFLRDWQRRLNTAGLAAISWPKEYGGRDATALQQVIYAEEMARRSAPEPLNRGAILHTGPTIIQWGTEQQKARFLPRILSAEEVWCQGFSEPDAGSDLASLTTRAEVKGNDFVVTGQKIWTSRAQFADWCFLLARTDPAAPRHRGLSCLIVYMHQKGVEVRPVKQISGRSGFSQVFFDEVVVPREMVVGAVDDGWRVATATLSFERAGQATAVRLERRMRLLIKLARDVTANGVPRIKDPMVRRRLALYATQVEAVRRIGAKIAAGEISGGRSGGESAIAKLIASETDQEMSEFGMDLAGPYAILTEGSPRAIKRGNVSLSYLVMRAATIGAGTSEIQRNVIGERLLGLPKDQEAISDD